MTNFINPEASVIEQEEIQFPEGVVRVKIIRSMLDGKMSGILSGAGGASCQLHRRKAFSEFHFESPNPYA